MMFKSHPMRVLDLRIHETAGWIRALREIYDFEPQRSETTEAPDKNLGMG